MQGCRFLVGPWLLLTGTGEMFHSVPQKTPSFGLRSCPRNHGAAPRMPESAGRVQVGAGPGVLLVDGVRSISFAGRACVWLSQSVL